MKSSPKLTSRFEEALVFTAQTHARQTRKKSEVPYVAHLLSVTALVIEAGGSEDAAIAALLHDAVEDQGGLEMLAEIRRRFGEQVAEIVDSCTDAYHDPKPAWKKRKENYIAHLGQATPEARLVSLADKVHNSRSILRDLQQSGDTIWKKFRGGKDGTLWYYRALLDAFQASENNRALMHEFERVVTEIENLA